MNVTFDVVWADADSDADADQGVLELKADRRFLARGVRWTDEIRDRTLRADVEAILKALAREARGGRTEKRRIASAKPVSDERRLDSAESAVGRDRLRKSACADCVHSSTCSWAQEPQYQVRPAGSR